MLTPISMLFKQSTHRFILSIVLFTMALPAFSLELGKKPPELYIENAGEITIVDGKTKYLPWSSSQINKITLLQIMRASNKSKEINMPFLDKFGAVFGNNEKINSITLINSRSIPRLFAGFMKKELKKNKIAHPDAIMINDKSAKVLEVWDIEDTLSVLLLLNAKGEIDAYHEGKLPEGLEDQWIIKINKLLGDT